MGRDGITSSGLLTASAQIALLPSILDGIDLVPPTSGTARVLIYDSENSTVSGKKVIATVETTSGSNSEQSHDLSAVAVRGIYAVIDDGAGGAAPAGCSYIVRFGLGL